MASSTSHQASNGHNNTSAPQFTAELADPFRAAFPRNITEVWENSRLSESPRTHDTIARDKASTKVVVNGRLYPFPEEWVFDDPLKAEAGRDHVEVTSHTTCNRPVDVIFYRTSSTNNRKIRIGTGKATSSLMHVRSFDFQDLIYAGKKDAPKETNTHPSIRPYETGKFASLAELRIYEPSFDKIGSGEAVADTPERYPYIDDWLNCIKLKIEDDTITEKPSSFEYLDEKPHRDIDYPADTNYYLFFSQMDGHLRREIHDAKGKFKTTFRTKFTHCVWNT